MSNDLNVLKKSISFITHTVGYVPKKANIIINTIDVNGLPLFLSLFRYFHYMVVLTFVFYLLPFKCLASFLDCLTS